MKIVVLDDYQQVAASFAAWESLDAEVVFVHEHLTGPALVDTLREAAVVVAMRERTPFDADLLARSDVVSLTPAAERPHPRRHRGDRAGADEAVGVPREHLPRPLVDEPALVAALDSGGIAGAGLDVYDEEPLPADDPLRSTPNTVLTPHLGYVTDGGYRLFYGDALEDIHAWQFGTPLRQPAPPPAG